MPREERWAAPAQLRGARVRAHAPARAARASVRGGARQADGGPPLLATKLRPPEPGHEVVVRGRLLALLDGGPRRRVTAVVAPAGSGKTTLLAGWARGTGAAWLSLEPEDSPPERLWAYVAGALDEARPGLGAAVRAGLAAGGGEGAATALVNRMAGEPPLTLVLDDLHAVSDERSLRSVALLLAHLPLELHVAVASRAEPPLPLAQWRAADALAELGACDLRLTPEEAGALVERIAGAPPAPAEAERLVEQTEGWAAGVCLAARAAARGGALELPGGHRDLQDYLAESVLGGLPEELVAFLLETAALDTFCAPLCAALPPPQRLGPAWDQRAAQELIGRAERAGLFLVPLDAERRWYRYHALVRDALRHRLQRERPGQLAAIRERAVRWREGDLPAPDQLAAPLSARELEVLRLLADGRGNQEIADALVIGLNTVKMHLQHLYGKLDSHSRLQAVGRARALGLLDR